MGAEPDEVRIQAREFSQQDPDPLRTLGNLELQQFFDGQAVAKVVCHGAEVVDAVGEGNHLLVELGFAGLFDSGVQVADFGIEADHDLAVNFQDQPQHAVGRWMLRPHVEDHVLVFGSLRSRNFEDGGAYDSDHQR